MDRTIRLLLSLLTILLFISITNADAQENFSPDRPGLGTGSYVIEPQSTYLETGFEYFEGGAIDQFSFGQVLFRHGLTPGMEMRVQLNSFVYETRPINNESGVPDPAVGLKFDILNKPWSDFTLSGLTDISIPAGYSPFTDNKYHPTGALLASYQISELWSVTSNAIYTFGPHETSDLVTLTMTPGFSIPDSRLSGYFGYAAILSESVNEHFVEAGLTMLATASLQFDVNTGIDLNSGNSFAGAGIALQF